MPPPKTKAPGFNKSETPISFILSMTEAYERRGLSPQSALELAQIPPHILRDTQAKVTSLQMEIMSAAAMQELDDEALGWFERPLPWGSYGMLLRASLTSPTLGVALQRWCRHHGLLTQSVRLQLLTEGAQATLSLAELAPLHNAQHHWQEFCVVSVLRNALGVAQWLIDSHIQLKQAQFAFAPPAHQASYPLFFNATTQFHAQQHAVAFDAGYLQLPIKRDEASLQRLLQRALPLTVRPYRRDRLLQERVRQLLLSQPGTRTADNIAAALNLSTRSLHRQLSDEGTRFQTIKDHVSQQRACELLSRSTKPIKHIAAEVGFSNEKSFIRAFKTWTGDSPGDWRAQHTLHVTPIAHSPLTLQT